MSELVFVPKILLCGDETEFLAQVGKRPFKIIGHVQINGIVDWGGDNNLNFAENGKLFFNGEVQELPALKNFLQSGKADYLVFNNPNELQTFRIYADKFNFRSFKIISLKEFKSSPYKFPYYADAEALIMSNLNGIRTLLDFDGYFLAGRLFTKQNESMEIDCISEKPLPPIKENIYSHIYKNLAEVGFKQYDVVLIAEREPAAFELTYNFLENFSEMVITFAQTGSELEKFLSSTAFEKSASLQTSTGGWHLLRRRKLLKDFCVYVVTHKPTPHDGKLPKGYKVIHAGRALKEDLGYLGDDSGDNISYLNFYLNEITALYWMWKNTTHSVIGLCHYRRFFTEDEDVIFSYDKILSKAAALKLLERYDIIVSSIGYEMMTQRGLIRNDCGEDLAIFVEGVIKKHLLRAQPDYLESFEAVMNSVAIYKCNMFVTRREIFEAWCSWLFSFYIDVTEEILQMLNLNDVTDNRRRILGYFSERMLTIWLRKNRLRIKELDLMFIGGI